MASTPVGKSSDACVLETYPLVFSFDPPLVLNGQWVPPQMYNQWCIFAHNQWCIYIYIYNTGLFLLCLIPATKMFLQRFWMKGLGHQTPKRTVLFSNTAWLVEFSFASKLKKQQLTSEVKTTDQYTSKSGRKRFKGNGNLKATQTLVEWDGSRMAVGGFGDPWYVLWVG